MKIRKLELSEALEIYHEHLVHDFPKAELKPFSRIRQMWEENHYMAYGLFLEERLAGYAYFVKLGKGDFILLDYFAVCRDQRCGGLGSRFLQLLREQVKETPGIILEVENPDFAKSESERQTMNRRIAFYERNGVVWTNVASCVFGVEYRILELPFGDAAHRDLYKEMEKMYHCIFSGKVYEENVIIRK